jgi:hypothetical protein
MPLCGAMALWEARPVKVKSMVTADKLGLLTMVM